MELEIKGEREKKKKSNRMRRRSVSKKKNFTRFRTLYSARIAAGRPDLQRDHAEQHTAAVDRPERRQFDGRLRAGIRAHLLESRAGRRLDK